MRGGAAWERLRVKANMVFFADNNVWSISERVRYVREDALHKSTLRLPLPKSHHEIFIRRSWYSVLPILNTTTSCRIKTRNNWVPASSDEDLVVRSKRQTKALKFWLTLSRDRILYQVGLQPTHVNDTYDLYSNHNSNQIMIRICPSLAGCLLRLWCIYVGDAE